MTEKNIADMNEAEFKEIAAGSIEFMQELIEKKGKEYVALVRQAVSFKVDCMNLQSEGKQAEAEELAETGSGVLNILCMVLGENPSKLQKDAQKLYDIAEEEVIAVVKAKEKKNEE